MQFNLNDIKFTYFKSSGPGGQHKNKKFTAVRVTHLPTGISVICSQERSQFFNKKIALLRLEQKLSLLSKKKKIRIPLSMPVAVKERILEEKRRNSQKKELRQKVKIALEDI